MENEIVKKINECNKEEKDFVLKYIVSRGIKGTKNVNGYFFNVSRIKPELLSDISNCINMIINQRDMIKTMNEKRNNEIEEYTRLVKISEKNTQRNIQKCFNDLIKVKSKVKITEIKHEFQEIPLQQKLKYPKESVYARILYKFKMSKQKTSAIIIENYDNEYECPDNVSDTFNDISEDDEQNEQQYDSDAEVEVDAENSSPSESDEDEAKEHMSNEIEDIEEIECEDEYTEEENIDKVELETSIDKYRKILYNKGYIFDDDKACILYIQDMKTQTSECRHPKRKHVISMFLGILTESVKILEYNIPEDKLDLMAENIELGIFNNTVKRYNNTKKKVVYWNEAFYNMYLPTATMVYSNIHPTKYFKNIQLIKKLFDNEITEFSLPSLKPNERCPDKHKKLVNKYGDGKDLLLLNNIVNLDDVPDSFIKCRRCKSNKVKWSEINSRAADEGAVLHYYCCVCGLRWKTN